jgi:hypothetical protein
MIKGWILVMFLAYSNGEGGAAAVVEKINFGTMEECVEARRQFLAETKGAEFRRSISFCAKQSF